MPNTTREYEVTVLHKWKRCEYARTVSAAHARAAKIAAIAAVIETAQGWARDYRVMSVRVAE